MDAGRLTRTRILLRALAAALLAAAVLRPPETYAWSGAVCAMLLAAAGWLAWRAAEGAPLLPAWTAGLLPLAVATLLLSSCRARAFDEAGLASTLLLAAILGRAIASDRRGREIVARVLVALGCIAAVLAVLQAKVTYREELRTLLEAPGTVSPYVLARLRDGRPAGPFTLPAALGGFFALTLPLTLFEARSFTDRGTRGALYAAAVLQSYALVLTRSVGGLLATAVSLSLSLPLLAARRRRILLAAVALLALAAGLHFLHARREEVNAPGGDPFLQRAGNWGAAAGMIRDHPLFGTGPGSFGTFYPRYMHPGMNETRYAHNSYLQAIAGWGAWAIVPLLGLLLAFAHSLRDSWRKQSGDLPFVAAAAAFLAHNLADFTAYLPGLAIPGALLVGLSLGPNETIAVGGAAGAPSPSAGAGRHRGAALAARATILAATLLAFAGHALVSARASDVLDRARSAAVEGSDRESLSLGRRAARARPSDPAPRAFVAEWVLAHGMDDESLRREGRGQAENAVRLDPQSAILHYDLSLYMRADHETGAAYREQWTAHLLFPLKEEYRLPNPATDGRTTP
jgi:O-antigen ligase/polysaccharide polymerase Wzy-like membrane protein